MVKFSAISPTSDCADDNEIQNMKTLKKLSYVKAIILQI